MQKGKILSLVLAFILSMAFATLSINPTYAQGGETDEARIYWSRTNTIIRAKMDGSDPETFLIGGQLNAPVFSADGSQMYGIGSDDVLRRANVDGTGLTEILAPGNDPTNLRIDPDAGKLYWLDDTSVRRANVDGSVAETIVMSQTNPLGLRLDLENDKLYWIDNEMHIRRANLDGSMVELVYTADPDTEEVGCLNIDPAGNRVYWLLHDGAFRGKIMRANTNGSGVEILPLEDICPVINVDNRKLYWVVRDLNDASIQRSDLDGGNVEEIVPDADIASNALSFDPAGGMLYWYESTLAQSKIRRVNVDGGPVENVVLLPTNPSGLYLNLAQQRMIWGIQGMLRSADLNGDNATTLLVGINTAGQLALDLEGGRIFWGDSFSVRVANLDGTELKIFWSEENVPLSNFSFGPSLIQVDSEAGRIYWIFRSSSAVTTAQETQDVLYSANLDGSDLKTEGKLPLTGPFALDLVNQKVYGYAPVQEEETVAQQLTRELTRVNFDGTAPEALGILDNQFGSFLNLAVDGAGGKVYWTIGGTQASIQQANLDGSEQSEFMADLSSPGLLKIDHRASQIYWTNVPGGDANSTERANLDGSARATIIDNNVNSLAFDPEGLGTPEPDQDDGNLLLPFILGN